MKIEKLLIILDDAGVARIIERKGYQIEREDRSAHAEDLNIPIPPDKGLWVYEVVPRFVSDEGRLGYFDYDNGSFRCPDVDEWKCIHIGHVDVL